ncbi:MAG: PEP-CTERM sorting domain-containing protein, partial [Planctomycetota bacterium]
TGDVADAFTEDENYHVFSAVVPTAGEIVIDWEETGSGGQFAQGPFNGFQLVAVPEPSSLALLGIGGLAMLQRRRH